MRPHMPNQYVAQSILSILCALGLGGLHTLCFAPNPFGGGFQIPVLTAFFALVARARTIRAAALTAGAFGFAHFVSGVFWVYISMHTYGGMPSLLALAALFLFALYLALYPAFAAALWRACMLRTGTRALTGWQSSLIFASAWTIAEWLRGTGTKGFPWLVGGYAQVDGPLAGYAALIGVYGISWLLALSAALCAHAIAAFWNQDKPRKRITAAAAPLMTLALLSAGSVFASKIHWTTSVHAPLTVRLLQGNIEQDMKFGLAGVNAALAQYLTLITARPADLIITPETALPIRLRDMPDVMARALRDFSDTTGSAILLGAVGVTRVADGAAGLTNSVFGITPHSRRLYQYDKAHLAPLGEFIPWGFRWFVQQMRIPLGDFTRGPAVQAPFTVHQQTLALSICYEDVFGEEIARTLRETPAPAGILLNVTNFAWFGKALVLAQSLQIARMRALETGRPVLRATNTGITAVIGADGRVVNQLPVFTVGALEARVQGVTGLTPYIRYGNQPVLFVSLLLLAFCAARRIVKRVNR